METCNKIEEGSCRGCNVPAILWRKIAQANRDQIDEEAAAISETYCPTGSGGIDAQTRATVYNYRVPNYTPQSVW